VFARRASDLQNTIASVRLERVVKTFANGTRAVVPDDVSFFEGNIADRALVGRIPVLKQAKAEYAKLQ